MGNGEWRMRNNYEQQVTRNEQRATDNERGILVGVEVPQIRSAWSLEDSLAELAQLARTADVEVVGQLSQRLERPNPATLIGKGKLEELQLLCRELDADVVIFDEELSPRQQRELEKALGEDVRVVDRTTLILDTFARHARTREGALQVELAQYEYRLPRLTRAWTHLARQVGGASGRGGIGGVGLRGPGETQLEVDRREIRRRIARLRRDLEEVRQHRELYRQRRREAALPIIALVGYTNAGKSTLLNALSDARVLTMDQLFATLDPTTRRIELPSGRQALLTDTVGFVQKLPTTLVAAFRATLEEITEADMLLHVVDITHSNARQQAWAVDGVLAELGVDDRPVVIALNKVDRLPHPEAVRSLQSHFSHSVPISALRGDGLDALLAEIERTLADAMVPVSVLIPYDRGELVSLFHELGQVEAEEHRPEGTFLQGRLPRALVKQVSESVNQ